MVSTIRTLSVAYGYGTIVICVLCNSRYMNGAGSNPDAHIFAMAAAQVKKGMEVAKKLGAENFGTKKNSTV